MSNLQNINDLIGNKGKMSHEEKFGSIINIIGIQKVARYLPMNIDDLGWKYKEDEHLNNVPLQKWDMEHFNVRRLLLDVGVNYSSMSDTVCILKQTAKILIKEENKNE